MAVTLISTDVWTERRRRAGELRARQGFVRQLLDFYGTLLGVQERAYRDAAAAPPPAASLAAYVAELVVPSVVEVTISIGPERMRSQLIHRLETEHPRDVVERWIRDQDQPLVDRFLARASLGPVLEAVDFATRSACAGPRDARHCPDCGGLPQLSYFAAGPEDLATGPRYLLCARCGATWGYPRMTCAGCGEESSAKLTIFSEHGTTSGERGSVVRGLPHNATPVQHPAVFPHMRIEACDTCRRYLLSVDLAADPKAVPIVDEVAAIPLDLYARDRGFTKITTNLMGF
jgi:FdhE protein